MSFEVIVSTGVWPSTSAFLMREPVTSTACSFWMSSPALILGERRNRVQAGQSACLRATTAQRAGFDRVHSWSLSPLGRCRKSAGQGTGLPRTAPSLAGVSRKCKTIVVIKPASSAWTVREAAKARSAAQISQNRAHGVAPSGPLRRVAFSPPRSAAIAAFGSIFDPLASA